MTEAISGKNNDFWLLLDYRIFVSSSPIRQSRDAFVTLFLRNGDEEEEEAESNCSRFSRVFVFVCLVRHRWISGVTDNPGGKNRFLKRGNRFSTSGNESLARERRCFCDVAVWEFRKLRSDLLDSGHEFMSWRRENYSRTRKNEVWVLELLRPRSSEFLVNEIFQAYSFQSPASSVGSAEAVECPRTPAMSLHSPFCPDVVVAEEPVTTRSEAVCTRHPHQLYRFVSPIESAKHRALPLDIPAPPKCRQPSSFSLPAVSHDVILEESESSSDHQWKKAKRTRKITFDLSMTNRDQDFSHLWLCLETG